MTKTKIQKLFFQREIGIFYTRRNRRPIYNSSLQDIPIGNDYTTSTFVVSESEFLSKIGAVSGDWFADIQSEKPRYLRFDVIMCTWDDNKPLKSQCLGLLLTNRNQDYRLSN